MNPFGISPRLDFVYASSAFSESKAHLVYGLESNEAIVMITGAIGTGKTMTVQSFLSQLGERHLTALVTNTSVDAKELLKLILDDLDAPLPRDADKSDLLIALKQLVIEQGREGRRVIIIIDEAQNLSAGVLEEIRLLTNLGQGEQQPVQVILVGQPELENIVARPELAQLRQRIRVHYRLVPLTRKELGEYIDHRMVVAGGRTGTFTGGALDRVFALSSGVPRVVNTLCNDALLAAFVAGRAKVETQDVESNDGMPAPVIVRPEPEIRAAAPDAPAEPAPAPGMAVRREPAARPQADDADAANLDGRSRRGLMLVPVLVVVAVAVVLALTGQLERFRGRPEAPATQAVALDAPVPAVIASDSAVVARSDTVPTVQAAGGDSLNAVAVTVPAETTPAATEAPAEQAKSVTPSLDASTTSVVPVAAPKEPAVQVAGSASGPWFIHVSSYTTPEQAAGVASKFAGAGHETSVREHLVNKSMWYRVYLGPYGDRKAAVTLAEEMRSNGSITYYQVQRLEPVATP